MRLSEDVIMMWLCILTVVLFATINVKSDTVEEDDGTLFDGENHPYHVIPTFLGKWKPMLLVGPFQKMDNLYCHPNKARCASGEAIDHLFTHRHLWCDVDKVLRDDLAWVSCDDSEESKMIPMICCEHILEGNTSVYCTPHEYIHYIGWEENPRSLVLAMEFLEHTYLPQLAAHKEGGIQPILLYSQVWEFTKEEGNVPLQVQKALLYQGPLP